MKKTLIHAKALLGDLVLYFRRCKSKFNLLRSDFHSAFQNKLQRAVSFSF